MQTITVKLVLSGILFVGSLGSGIALNRSGRPYSGLWFNIHKFTSLFVITLLVMAVVQLMKEINRQSFQIVMLGISAISFLITLISGGIIHGSESAGKLFIVMHKTGAGAFVLFSVLVIYLMMKSTAS